MIAPEITDGLRIVHLRYALKAIAEGDAKPQEIAADALHDDDIAVEIMQEEE